LQIVIAATQNQGRNSRCVDLGEGDITCGRHFDL
jgi:hypothetical protein